MTISYVGQLVHSSSQPQIPKVTAVDYLQPGLKWFLGLLQAGLISVKITFLTKSGCHMTKQLKFALSYYADLVQSKYHLKIYFFTQSECIGNRNCTTNKKIFNYKQNSQQNYVHLILLSSVYDISLQIYIQRFCLIFNDGICISFPIISFIFKYDLLIYFVIFSLVNH